MAYLTFKAKEWNSSKHSLWFSDHLSNHQFYFLRNRGLDRKLGKGPPVIAPAGQGSTLKEKLTTAIEGAEVLVLIILVN